MQFNELIVTQLLNESVEMRDSDPQCAKLIVECLVIYQPHLKVSNICNIIFDASHQKLNEAFLMITVSENIPYVREVKFTSSFGDFICHDTIETCLQSSILEEGKMTLRIRFSRLHKIVSLDVLVL